MPATESLWASTSARPTFARLQRDLHVNVAILGGGITGITAALLLTEAGKRVAVLEARRVGGGVTSGTTAHLTEVLDTRFHELERKFGTDGVRQVVRSSQEAMRLIENLVRRHALDCGFERVPGYLFAATKEQSEDIDRELDVCRRLGIRGEQDWAPLPIPSFGAIRFDDQAQFRPLDYVLPLARRIVEQHNHVFEESRAVAIEDGEPCRVHTDTGVMVTADHVVMATHAPLNRVLLQTRLAHYRSYVVSGPVEQAPHGLFWDAGDPYHYIRAVRIGPDHHLIVGGEDHKTGQEDDTERPFARLESYAARLGLRHVEKRWSAQVVEPVDGLPFIGRNAASSNVFVSSGYSGNGMIFGTLGAMILSDACLGRRNRFAELYKPTRKQAFSSLETFVTENVDYPVHLLTDRLRSAEVRSVHDIPRGKGAMVRVYGRRFGVYRDERDRLLAVNPVCTHLGCYVVFNDAERTWDCPCHGSRFKPDGTIVDGPAVKPLKCRELKSPERARPSWLRLRRGWAR